jgi:hypothetical protein
MTAAWHRVRQFGKALAARVRPQERDLVKQILPPGPAELFWRMPRQDQRHSLDLLYALQKQGLDAADLLVAGLLHDAAKSEGVRTWHRVAWVLLENWHPEWLAQLASSDATSWRRGFWVQLHHADLSAELAEAGGCSARTVELIRHHHDRQAALPPPLQGWLQALQAVDGESGDEGA